MLDVEQLVQTRYPRIRMEHPLFARSLVTALRLLFHEPQLRQFEQRHPHLRGFDFVAQLLEYFDFSYQVNPDDLAHIPASGGVVIIANHPLGTLDGLALLNMVQRVRTDVKIVANDILNSVAQLQPLLLPVDNMNGNTSREQLKTIRRFLAGGGALIIFPAGEVSRLGPHGIKDGKWLPGFLRIAATSQAPLLPVHINARNSMFFYGLSWLARPLSSLWLVREMFKHRSRGATIRIGAPIGHRTHQRLSMPPREKARLLQCHVYELGRGRPGLLATETPVAAAEDRARLQDEIRACELLGVTEDNKQIYLYQHPAADASLMREIGRLRELSFRAVGEGTGRCRDIDRFDQYYLHLVLWDEEQRDIVGAYRFCASDDQRESSHENPLYSTTLFDFKVGMTPYLERGLELGRSFVQPKYWGKRSLEYLWCGIGAFLRRHPGYRYLFGPVTLSGAYPRAAIETLVHFYRRHFSTLQSLVEPKQPFTIDAERLMPLARRYPGINYREEFACLKSELARSNLRVPTLYKQYTEICEPGGVQFAGFNVDPAFGDCVDGLIIVDLVRLRASTRKKYITEPGTMISPAASPLRIACGIS